jgi:hypothetical protein
MNVKIRNYFIIGSQILSLLAAVYKTAAAAANLEHIPLSGVCKTAAAAAYPD